MQENTVESESQQERILARRERIAARVEQNESFRKSKASNGKARNGSNFDQNNSLSATSSSKASNSINVKTADKAKKEIETSLEELISQGKSILADVKIASTNHESTRRNQQEKQQREMIERLNTEAHNEAIKFQEIAEKWKVNNADKMNPGELYELLNEQNDSCKGIISQKNKIINLLKEVARTAEDRYVKDLKRENDDIELISKRMEHHVKEMASSFQTSLNRIQDALISDRNQTLDAALQKSENSWKARTLREIEMVYLRLEETDNYMIELDEIRERGAEEYAIMRNKLESDVMTHEQQLQQMKAIYQLNQEKLQYNHEILRNREDENNIIKAQQKRRITKLQDNLNSHRQKLVKQEQQQKNEAAQLSDDYERIVNQTNELEAKMRHFENSDSKRFHEVWKMNFNTVKQLASECLCADRIIHLQQLGIHWDKEDEKVWFVDKADVTDSENLMNGASNGSTSSGNVFSAEPILAPWQEKDVKKIINIKVDLENEPAQETAGGSAAEEAVATGTNEQIENKNNSSSLPKEKVEVTHSKISNVIDIKSTNQLVKQVSRHSKLSQHSVRNLLPLLAEEGDFLFEKKLAVLLTSLESSHSTLIKLDAIFSALNIQAEEDITILVNHLKEKLGVDMDINKVVPALKEYVMIYVTKSDRSHGGGGQSINSENDRSGKSGHHGASFSLVGQEWAALDSKYWKVMEDVIDKRKINLWDALDSGLTKYNDQLMERRNLIEETDKLKRQNNELRMLLQQYLCSKVNQELQIPPTKVLQSEATRCNSF